MFGPARHAVIDANGHADTDQNPIAGLCPPTRTRTTGPTPTHTPTATPLPTHTQAPIAQTATPTSTLPSGCPDLIVNGGFETGALPPWTLFGAGGVSGPGRNSERAAWLAGADGAHVELAQEVALPAGAEPVRLAFWWRANATAEQPDDLLSVVIQHERGADDLLDLPANAPLGQWRYVERNLNHYAG